MLHVKYNRLYLLFIFYGDNNTVFCTLFSCRQCVLLTYAMRFFEFILNVGHFSIEKIFFHSFPLKFIEIL